MTDLNNLIRSLTTDNAILNDKLYDLLHINLQQPITKKMNNQINHILFIYGFT